ncbi:MAG: glycosyltransferase family 2 protein [Planctomycetes bacterium]|nr:glycosyltransferase family 2 protein [Planctomycetota bacterium]
MKTSLLPKISCLTATYNRLFHLKQAIQCYCDQTYPNKELVVVSEAGPPYTEAIVRYVNSLKRPDIRLIFPKEEQLTLGKIRNISLNAAEGEIVCQWDDDDLYHPQRLQVQADYLLSEGAGACFMTDQLQYFWDDAEMYWVDWGPCNMFDPLRKLIPGTMMMFKDPQYRYPEEGELANAGEDSVFVERIFGKLQIAALRGQGHLYIYSYHGSNTFSEDHHRLIPHFHACDLDFIRERVQDLKKALTYYPLPLPYSFRAKGVQPLFVWH